MMHDDYDGFGIRIQQEGNVIVVHFIELPEVAASGATVTVALVRLKAEWEKKREIYINN